MSLVDAVLHAGEIPSDSFPSDSKKRYSEVLSKFLAEEIADGLRSSGFPTVKPDRDGVGEKAFYGGLGSKKVDVSYSDERHGLMLAVSVKTICAPPFGKNLKNRFGDMCTEAITLHMRFPYSVVCGLFAFPVSADEDISKGRPISTFRRATRLFATISGRREHTDAPEKFENVTMMLFQPADGSSTSPWIKLIDSETEVELSEEEYFGRLGKMFSVRNPHMFLKDLD